MMNRRVARTINPDTNLGGPHVGFTCGAFDFAFFLPVPLPRKPFTPAPQPFNPQFPPFPAKYLTKSYWHAILSRVCQAPLSPISGSSPH